MIEAQLITNAVLESHEWARFMEHCVDGEIEALKKRHSLNQKMGTPLFSIKFKDKNVFMCQSGGVLDKDENLLLTEVGLMSSFVGSLFVSPNNKVFVQQITCFCGKDRMKEKVLKAFDKAVEGDLVNFVGNFRGECGGRILNLLNVTGAVEAKKWK